jgi:hypothetical protein
MAVGLSGAEDPFARRRQEAAEAYLPKTPPPDEETDEGPDLGKQAGTVASKPPSSNASNPASIGAGTSEEDTTVPTATADVAEPAPPPAREPIARVQFNQRIRSDYRKVLDRYRRQHGATWQGLFDQMVKEYLERRELLPHNDETK